ncbi:unnamed protein product [Gadus morhua 'NCC']
MWFLYNYAEFGFYQQVLPTFCWARASRRSLVDHLENRGFFVVGEPLEDAHGAEPSSQETGHRPGHKRLLEMAEGRTEEACHGLLTGERLPQHEMTLYRYFCMATLTITHRVPEETVVDFKVTEWNDRQVSAGVGATIYFRDGADRAVFSVDEERWLGAYFTAIRPLYLTRKGEAADDQGCFFLGTTGLPVANPRSDLCRLWRHCRKICEGAGPNPPPVTAEATGTSSRDKSSVSGKGSRDDQWDAFVSEFPVTIGALAPSKDKRNLSVPASAGRQQPTKAKVAAIVAKEEWKTNVPSLPDVLQAWVSPLKAAIEDDKGVLKSVVEQRWKGIDFKDFREHKGRGVIATMPFSKGEVICDCHGKLISESDTFGRRMNDSGKASNVKPVVFQLNFADGPQDTVLFLAQRNIAGNEELRWDYGVRRMSFRDEGMDLAWLDD